MKISVPAALDLLPADQLRASEERMVLVKYLKRASGSLMGDVQSNREKVCLTGTGTGRSTIAPGYVGVTRALPKTFCMCTENNEFISGVRNEDRTMVCRRCFALPSRYHVLTRLKSQPCASFGCRLRCENMYSTCSQFCMRRASAWSATTISIDERKS